MVEDESNGYIPIKAFVRVKPEDSEFIINDNSITVLNSSNKSSAFMFDRVFGPQSTTEEIFSELLPSIDRMESTNATIIAYGQTGPGKTYTMSGNGECPGLVQMILKELLKKSEIKVSFIEIYNEKILDLFDNVEKQLRELNGKIFVQGLLSKPLSSLEEFDRYSSIVMKNRKTAETKLNKLSSRSHLIVRISTNEKVLNLVDLAGSENNRRTGNEGERMKESLSINTSLFVLNKVVHSIINKEPRIPYRDSKLTRMLQETIGGEGECCIIATIIDKIDEAGEALSTLNFAMKSKKITNQKEIHIDKTEQSSIFTRLHSRAQPNNTNREPMRRQCYKRVGNSNTGNIFPSSAATIPADHTVKKNKSDRSSTDVRKNETNTISSPTTIEQKGERCTSYKTANTKKLSKPSRSDSSSTIKSSFIHNKIEMTPITKKKSMDCFLAKAKEYEDIFDFKSALETYKTVYKFAPSELVHSKIQSLQKLRKKEIQKFPYAKALEILNSGSFVDIKKLNGVGDKRAQIIVDFILGGNAFESIDDLKLLFNEKIVNCIFECIG